MLKILCLVTLFVAGPGFCESFDGAPDNPPPVQHVKDAVPKWEPLSRFGNAPFYTVGGKQYDLTTSVNGFKQRGIASWYGTKFHHQKTSSGETYNMYAMTAAHKTLPIPSYARVTNLKNGKQIVVKINDRGPFHSKRIVDLSYAAATKLGITTSGTGMVELEVLPPKGRQARSGLASKIENAKLYVQIGAFTLERNAKIFATKITSLLHRPVAIRRNNEGDQPIYRVQIGPLAENRLFTDIRDKLMVAGLGQALAVVE